MRKAYEERKQLVKSKLKEIESLSFTPCEGAFYSFPKFSQSITSKDMLTYLSNKGILVRSGTEFVNQLVTSIGLLIQLFHSIFLVHRTFEISRL